MKSNYSVLASVVAGLNGLALAIAGALYYLRPDLVASILQVEILAGLAALVVLYFGSVHQAVKKRWLGASVALMTVISAANLGFLILETGGLDSPFYAFWLLGIVAAGLFGSPYVLGLLAVTAVGTGMAFASHQFSGSYMAPKAGQLLITLFAAGLAEWIHWRDKKQAAPTAPQAHTLPAPKKNVTTDILMSHMADGVIVVDSAGTVKLMNKAAEEMTGWDSGSAVGLNYRSVLELKTTNDQPAEGNDDPFYRSGLEHKNLVVSDLSLYSRSGSKMAVSISIAPIGDEVSQPSSYVAVMRDISKEKEIERQRSEFISTASHEMRTPVAAIEGYLALAMNPKVATVDARAMEYLTKAHNNTKHLGALFGDLLSVSKLEEGLKPTKLVAVNLSEMLKEIIADMELTARKKGLTITYASTAAGGNRSVMPLYYVLAEPERLREVVINLIDNAIKFTSQGGITVGMSADPKIVTVRITDTGPGIAPESIKHLFQKFYRVDNSATRTIGGTGLGLYLCRSIIELFNGRIWVESELGKGSSFNFSLVRTQPHPELAVPQALKPATLVTPHPEPLQPVITPAPATVVRPNVPVGIDGVRAATKVA